MRRSTPPLLLLAFSLGLGALPPASAGSDTLVQMLDTGTMRFAPKTVAIPMGSRILWRNDGTLRHTTTTLTRYPSTWDRNLAPDASYAKRFSFAGTFPYYCTLHSNGTGGMVGTVRIPLRISPVAGSTSTAFTVRVATEAPPEGWAFEVQRRIGSGAWQTIRNRLEARTMTYRSTVRGTHGFRARLERISPALSHRFSPLESISIS